MTEDTSDALIRQTGFLGLQAVIRDSSADVIYQGSMMVSVAPSDSVLTSPEVSIIDDTGDQSTSRCLVQLLNGLDVASSVATLTNVDPSGKVCITLWELVQSVPKDPSSDQFEMVRKILIGSADVLWVVGTSTPEFSMVNGLTRTVGLEIGGTPIVTLNLEP